MAIEIVDLPMKNGDFPVRHGTVYHRLSILRIGPQVSPTGPHLEPRDQTAGVHDML